MRIVIAIALIISMTTPAFSETTQEDPSSEETKVAYTGPLRDLSLTIFLTYRGPFNDSEALQEAIARFSYILDDEDFGAGVTIGVGGGIHLRPGSSQDFLTPIFTATTGIILQLYHWNWWRPIPSKEGLFLSLEYLYHGGESLDTQSVEGRLALVLNQGAGIEAGAGYTFNTEESIRHRCLQHFYEPVNHPS